MWEHKTRRTKFCVCVDDFGIKYYTHEDAMHLLNAIGKSYDYTVDWTGSNYCGLHIVWDYEAGRVNISMPGYVKKALNRLQHTPHTSPQHSPHQHVPIQYGEKGCRQFAPGVDTSRPLSAKETTELQSTVETFLYYGRAVDSSILPALNSLAREQSKPTENTKRKAQRLMDYLATYPNASIQYEASNMILHVDSDAAYLVAPKARSRIAGYYYLTDIACPTTSAKLNGAVQVECKTLRHVVTSAAEAEVAGVFHNTQMAIPIRRMLEKLNHIQPPTPIKTDNSTATGFIYDNIHQKRSKSWDMRYYWLRDRILQKQFKFFWEKGESNHADYFTKHHATIYHRATRSKYIQDVANATSI
jgi:hypothetical protein